MFLTFARVSQLVRLKEIASMAGERASTQLMAALSADNEFEFEFTQMTSSLFWENLQDSHLAFLQ